MPYPYHPLTCNYIMLLSHLQSQTTKSTALEPLLPVFQVGRAQSEKGTCMKKPISMLCNTATSKPMSLSCHPITGEQQINASFLS